MYKNMIFVIDQLSYTQKEAFFNITKNWTIDEVRNFIESVNPNDLMLKASERNKFRGGKYDPGSSMNEYYKTHQDLSYSEILTKEEEEINNLIHKLEPDTLKRIVDEIL